MILVWVCKYSLDLSMAIKIVFYAVVPYYHGIQFQYCEAGLLNGCGWSGWMYQLNLVEWFFVMFRVLISHYVSFKNTHFGKFPF